eukprot:1157391-Pelagomonas_calceolata.AAC.6
MAAPERSTTAFQLPGKEKKGYYSCTADQGSSAEAKKSVHVLPSRRQHLRAAQLLPNLSTQFLRF